MPDESDAALAQGVPKLGRKYERLLVLSHSMAEFRAGYELFLLSTDPGNDHLAPRPRMFLYNSLAQYMSNYYLSAGGANMLGVVREMGLGHHADRVEALLARKIGPSTVRKRLSDFRGKLLVHSDYTHGRILKLKREHDADRTYGEYKVAMGELLDLTYAIAQDVARICEALTRGVVP